MKTNIIKVLFGLILTFSISGLYAQSPRIKLNQIVKDTVSGSVLISNLADSNMVYSRNFYIGSDTSLVFFGTTIVAGGGGGGSFVTLPQLTDSLALYATKVQLSDSMATVLKQVATDLTLTGTGTDASPLKVDTAVIATIKAISDSLAALSFASLQDITDTLDLNTRDYITGLRLTDTLNTNSRAFLTQNQTITLTDDATGSGTTSISVTVVDDSHNHTISTLTGIQDSLNSKAALVHTHTISEVAFLQDSLDAKANDSDLNNYLLTSNYIVDSTRINLTGDTALYYQNGVLIGTGAIAGGGIGLGTVTSVDVSGGTTGLTTSGGPVTTSGTITIAGTLDVDNGGTGATSFTAGQMLKGNGTSAIQAASNLRENGDTVFVAKYLNVDTATLYVDATNNTVGIGSQSTTENLKVDGDVDLGNGILYIDTTSNRVAIGHKSTLYPFYKLDIRDTVGIDLAVSSFGTATNGSSAIAMQTADNEGFTNGKYIQLAQYHSSHTGGTIFGRTRAGLSLIRASSPSSMMIGHNSNADLGFATNSTERMTIKGNGDLKLHPSTSGASSGNAMSWNSSDSTIYFSSSSIRFKENISDYDKGISTLMEMKPVYFNYKTSQQLEAGFIAEDIENIGLDEYITKGGDGLVFGLRVGAFKPLIVKAIQEQQSIIESQATEIEQLKTQIQLILTEIEQLKNK